MSRNTNRWSLKQLHERFLAQCSHNTVRVQGAVRERPLEVDLLSPLPQRIRLYLYNATSPPGGRTLGEHKVQLIVPGQKRGMRGDFDHSGGRTALLGGYVSDDDVFVFWDAGLYVDFAWSRNVQVKPGTVIRASAGQIVTQQRRLRPRNAPSAIEVLVAGPASRLEEVICRRVELTRERILQE